MFCCLRYYGCDKDLCVLRKKLRGLDFLLRINFELRNGLNIVIIFFVIKEEVYLGKLVKNCMCVVI